MHPTPLAAEADDRPTPTRAQVNDLLDGLEGHTDEAVRRAGAQLRLYLVRRGSQHGFHELLEGIHDRLDDLARPPTAGHSLPPQPQPAAVAQVLAAQQQVPQPQPAAPAAAPATTPAPAAKPSAGGDQVQLEAGPVKLSIRPLHLLIGVVVLLAIFGAASIRDMVWTTAREQDLAIPDDRGEPDTLEAAGD